MIHVLDVVVYDLHPRGIIDLCVELSGEGELVRVDEQCSEVISTIEPTRTLEIKKLLTGVFSSSDREHWVRTLRNWFSFTWPLGVSLVWTWRQRALMSDTLQTASWNASLHKCIVVSVKSMKTIIRSTHLFLRFQLISFRLCHYLVKHCCRPSVYNQKKN